MTDTITDSKAATLAAKSALRRELSEARLSLSAHKRATAEATIRSRLFELPAWQSARTVCGYTSTRGEPDLVPIWREAAAAGKTYALPVTLSGAREGRMAFRSTPAFCPERLSVGRFGIAEPPDEPDFPVLTSADLRDALVLIPALGFDRDGYRIGYGGGYYDRFLDALRADGVTVYTVGLCFSVCRRDRLPREAHDRAVDTVVDESGVLSPHLIPSMRSRA